MNYNARFTAITTDGRKFDSREIGTAYYHLHFAEGERNSGHIRPYFMDHQLIGAFDRIEDVIADLLRHPDREHFQLAHMHYIDCIDGASSWVDEETSLLSFEDLAEYLIANYSALSLPIYFFMDLATKSWRYEFMILSKGKKLIVR